MKTYISYVIQEPDKHVHHAEIISYQGPAYLYTENWQETAVSEWMEKKSKELGPFQELIITGVFKLSANNNKENGNKILPGK